VLTRSRISRLVDELVATGLVERVPDLADRRGSLAALTPAGRDALKAAAPVYLAGISRHFTAHLNADEIPVIVAALSRVVQAHQPLITIRSSR
jgi:DNA-binding MarR family transcriptional regulator